MLYRMLEGLVLPYVYPFTLLFPLERLLCCRNRQNGHAFATSKQSSSSLLLFSFLRIDVTWYENNKKTKMAAGSKSFVVPSPLGGKASRSPLSVRQATFGESAKAYFTLIEIEL